MASASNGNCGYLILTDPHQKKDGLYRVIKTTNATTSITQMNIHRARRDTENIAFYPCHDLVKAESLIKTALKTKLVPGSVDWVFCPDEKSVDKLKNMIETLVDIGNEN